MSGFFYSEYNKATGCWELTYRYNKYIQVAPMNVARWKDEGHARMKHKILYIKRKMRTKVANYVGRPK